MRLVLRRHALGIEPPRQFHRVGGLLAHGMIVSLEANLCSGLDEFPGAFRIHLPALPLRPLGKERRRQVVGIRIRLDEMSRRMVGDSSPLEGRLRLGGAHVSSFSFWNVDRGAVEREVLRLCRHGPRLPLDHEVWRSQHRFELETIARRPLLRGGHVADIAERRPGVDPLDDRVDLIVGQGPIVAKLLNADGLVQVPWRHLTIGDARLDRPYPRTHLLIGDQGHRRHAPGHDGRLRICPGKSARCLWRT